MTILANKPYYKILKQDNHRLLEFYWLNHDQPMTSEDFKQGCKELTRYIKLVRPDGLLISYLEMKYIIPYDMQLWFIKDEAASWLKSSLKKIALVVNHDLLIQDSLENIIEESAKIFEMSIPNRYFSDIESAKKWLLAE